MSRVDEALSRLDAACRPRSLERFRRADVLVLLASWRREHIGRLAAEAELRLARVGGMLPEVGA